jgi:hypothetical protein
MAVHPFVWFVVGSMSLFAVVLGWASWFTRSD